MNYGNFLSFNLPEGWCAESNLNNLYLYHPNGTGALTISHIDLTNTDNCLDEQMSILAKRFVDRNKITLHAPLIFIKKAEKALLYGTGSTSDGWFVKLWLIAKQPKIVLATYQSNKKNKEIKICDSIVDSFQIAF